MPCYYPGCRTATLKSRFGSIPACSKHSVRSIANLKVAVPIMVPGATIDDEGERFGSINIDAPGGMIWGANGCHALKVDWSVPGGKYRDRREEGDMEASAVIDALERLEGGVDSCDDPECDICHPELIDAGE